MSHCVYFMRAFYSGKVLKKNFGFINWKIGRTFNIERRRKTFQTACPVPIDVVGTLACPDRAHAIRLEQQLHEYFADSRISGEWFNFDYHQCRVIHALIDAWPVSNSLQDFAECLPKKPMRSDEAIKLAASHQLMPLAAHLAERKRLQARINELQKSAPSGEVADLKEQIAKLRSDNIYVVNKATTALDYLTNKYAAMVSSFKGHPSSSFQGG